MMVRPKRVVTVLLAASACLSAADPVFLRRQLADVNARPDDLTANARAASYKPLFGVGDQDADQLKGIVRYGELTVAPGGSSALVSYPAEEQMYFIADGAATVLYGDEKASVRKNDFLYLPVGVKHGIANPSNAPVKVIVMGYKIAGGTNVQATPKLMLANADDVQLQILGKQGIANPSNAPVKVIVMGYKIAGGTNVQATPKLMLANADDVQLQILGQ